MGQRSILNGSDELLDLNLSIVVRKLIVSEIVVDLGSGQELKGLEERGLTKVKSLGKDDACQVDLFFLRR